MTRPSVWVTAGGRYVTAVTCAAVLLLGLSCGLITI